MKFRATLLLFLLAPACKASTGPAAVDTGSGDTGQPPSDLLPRLHPFDPAGAARGHDALLAAPGASIPLQALRSLWIVWGQPGLSDEAYWAEFSSRYGFVPRDGSLYPWGVVVDGSNASIQCLACHVDRVAGQAVIGAGNGRIELSKLYEDLVQLADLAQRYGYPVPDIPQVWQDAFSQRTGAPGATDAFGMGMTLASAYDPSSGVETRYGFQQPPAWWQLPFKDRAYVDGMAPSDNFRLMLATELASGAPLGDLTAMESTFGDIRQYLLSLDPPAWPFDPPDTSLVESGRAVFEQHCSSCHGTYGGPSASYPDVIADVGTDPTRQERFTETEASWLSSSWFGDPPVMDTDGYLAPPLIGIWATAPYLHNGSVPDLRALLRPSERPVRWRRVATGDDYDPVRVGVRFETASAGDPEAYDTTQPGLSAAGHEQGASLTDDEVDALLAYLVTL